MRDSRSKDDERSPITASARIERRPALALAIVAAIGMLFTVVAILIVTRAGWLGAGFVAAPDGCAAIAELAPGGPLERAGAKAGDCLISLVGPTGPVSVGAADLTTGSDRRPTHAEQLAFFAHQTLLAEALAQNHVTAVLRQSDGVLRERSVRLATRPLSSLPLPFWMAILAGNVGLVVGGWVLMLRARAPGAIWLGLAGVGLFVAAAPEAADIMRELAIEGRTHEILHIVSDLGHLAIGLGGTYFFLAFPNRIGPAWLRPALFIVLGAWWAVCAAGMAPTSALHLLRLTLLASVFAAAAAQALLAWSDASKRSALAWLGATATLCVVSAAALVTGPHLLGLEPLMAPSYRFVIYAVFFVGVAVSVGRHRLFDLGRWSYRILFYAVGAAAMLAVDALLLYGLRIEPGVALTLSVLLIGLIYLPARDLLWRRYASPRRPPMHVVFGKALDVAFAVDPSEQDRRWREVLEDLFDPLKMEIATSHASAPVLVGESVEMVTPPVAGAPPLRLRYPYGGKALFSQEDVKVTARLVELVRHAESGRDDYARGVLEERARIARDLHDDLGARLLAGAVGSNGDTRALSHAALKDLRDIIADLTAASRDLDECLANLRQETAERLADAGFALDWPPIDEGLSRHQIDPRRMKALASSVREAISNAIRHSGGARVTVRVEVDGMALRLHVQDDGGRRSRREPRPDHRLGEGRGLRNMRERMRAAGGDSRIEWGADGVAATMELPLRPVGRDGAVRSRARD